MMVKGKASLLPLPLEPGAAWRHGHTHTHFIALGPGLLFPLPAMPSLPLGIQFRCHTLNSKLSYCSHGTRVNRPANFLQ